MAKKTQEDFKNLQSKLEEYDKMRVRSQTRNVWEYTEKYYRDTENRIRNEFQTLYEFFRNTYHKLWDKRIWAYCMIDVERDTYLECNNMNHRTNQYYPVTRSRIDYAIQALFRWKITNIVRSLNRKKSKSKDIKVIQNFLNSCYSSGWALWAIKAAWFDAALLWVWFFRNDFIVLDNWYWKWEFEWIDPYSLYFNPSRDFYKSPLFMRKIDNIMDVINNDINYFRNSWLEGYTLTEEQIAYITNNPQPISYEDPSNIRNIRATAWLIASQRITTEDFYKADIKDNTCEYIRREHRDHLAILINWYLVYDWKNPRWNHPVKVIKKSAMPWTVLQDWIGWEMQPFQDSYNAIQNIIFDVQKMTAWPMFFKTPWVKLHSKHINKDWSLKRTPFGILDIDYIDNWKPPLEPWYIPTANAELFRLANDILSTSHVLRWHFNYSQFETQTRVKPDAEMRRKTLADSIVTLSESIWEALNRVNDELVLIAKQKWIEKIDFYNIENNKQVWESITKDQLDSNYLFETEFESIKDLNLSIEREQLIEFLWYINMLGRDPVSWRFLFDMEKLIPKVIEMFPTLDEDVILSEAEFYNRQMNSQEKEMELKANIQELKERMMPQMTQWQVAQPIQWWQWPSIVQSQWPTQWQPPSFEELYWS